MAAMLMPAFQLHLQERVQRGCAAIGCFDAQHASLVGATHAGKAFVHNPHDPAGQQLSLLNINKQITALIAGAILPNSTRDVLLIGSPTTLQCYDLDRNRDLFFKDVPEGVGCLVAGSYGSYTQPLAIAGGNCSGFDSDGADVFWSVTGGAVTALALADVDGDGRNELLVGCDDFEIRVFKEEDMILQITEADVILGLAHLGGARFAYALRNGTIGAYEGAARLWRVKSRHGVAGVLAFDLDGDGEPELVSGWSNGRVEARHAATGEVVHRDTLGGPVAALMRGDLRGMGGDELVVVGVQGEVRGYAVQRDDLAVDTGDVALQQRALADLAARKQARARVCGELMHELAAYQTLDVEGGAAAAPAASAAAVAAALPPGARVDGAIAINRATLACELTLTATCGCEIKAAMVFGEQLFEGESLLAVPDAPAPALTVRLAPARDAAAALMIKALVGNKGSSVFTVFEIEMEMPKYAMYAAVEGSGNGGGGGAGDAPGGAAAGGAGAALLGGPGAAAAAAAAAAKLGSVTFEVRHPLQRLAAWVESRFSTRPTVLRPDSLEAYFTGLRDRRPIGVRAAPAPDGGGGLGGGSALQVTILTDDMDLAGDLVQDLAAYLGLEDLASRASFPAAMDAFKATLAQARGAGRGAAWRCALAQLAAAQAPARVDELSAARGELAADAADAAALLKLLVVRAEDARLLGDMAGMRRAYRQLYDLNRDLIAAHETRAANHGQLLDGLRAVNRMIQRAARLRVGPPQARAVAACRAAVKHGGVAALARIVRDGDAPGAGAGGAEQRRQREVAMLLEGKNLMRALPGKAAPVFSGISFSVSPGDVLFIRGPSGAGKTLLLRAVALLDPLQGGALRLRGQTPSELGIPVWRTEVTYVHQARVDFPGTPLEFFEAARGLAARKGRPCGDLAALAGAMGLESEVVLNQKWASLSGGQAQRAALAVAVALRPSVLLLDEPTSACDPDAAMRVEAVLRASGAAVVWVTHDPGQPRRVGGAQLELPEGRLAAIDAPEEGGGGGGGLGGGRVEVSVQS
ncbi:MAG: ciliary BBSome complex subunit 2 [Monoraphidium minutum]|nr:MAG: ciliary BBSome complex subunit 2 [Monoraphidium minutum]